MNTKELTGEQISALADGECADSHVETALAALRQAKGKSDWELYHQIGDVLRSDDMAITLSPTFSERMAARLDAEPTIVAPTIKKDIFVTGASIKHSTKRWALSGMVAAAAAATVAFFATPQLMVALKSEPAVTGAAMVASTEHALPVKASASASNAEQAAVVTASVSEGVVLRDPRIDDYLLAHQRFSPSLYSTAQYARSATFATDSNK